MNILSVEQKAQRAAYQRAYRLDPIHKAKAQARERDYRERHREEQAAHSKSYYAAHKEEARIKAKERREQHPEINRNKCRAYRASHLEEMKAKSRAYYAQNREKRLIEGKLQKYGISREDLSALFEGQSRRCAICGTDKFNGVGPCIDHDHASGAVRGILCVSCNSVLGHAKDNQDILRAAIKYLQESVR